MYSLFIHDDARADLEALWDSDAVAAARITVLLQECEGNQDLLDRLSQQDYGSRRTASFHVAMWVAQQHQDRNLWRLKLWDLEGTGLRYRIVYAFKAQRRQYHVLAIAPRGFNYDESHPITRRIIEAWEQLY